MPGISLNFSLYFHVTAYIIWIANNFTGLGDLHMPDTTALSGSDLKNYAYNTLKERLITCTYAPGSILNEAHLTADLKLSRTPVREAVSRLECEGFVKVLPKKGIYVTDILLSDTLQIFQIRSELEPIILRLSATRLPREEILYFCDLFEHPDENASIMQRIHLDTAMHLFIIEHCGNRYMVDIMHRVYDVSTRVIYFIHQNHATVHDDGGENLEILKLLLEQDVEAATEKMRIHMEHCRQAALSYFYSIPDPMAPQQTYKDKLNRV